MWVKVIVPFRDKYTNELYKPGDRLNIKKERIDEILKVGKFVEKEGKKAAQD